MRNGMRSNISRHLLTVGLSSITVLFLGLSGCWFNKPAQVGEINVRPSRSVEKGKSATLTIDVSGLGANDVIQWISSAGRFERETDNSVTVWLAPNEPGT